MLVGNLEVTKEKNILSVKDTETNKRVYADLSNGLCYGLNNKTVIRLPEMFVKVAKHQYRRFEEISEEGEQLKRLVDFIHYSYTHESRKFFSREFWEEYLKVAVPFCEKVVVLGLRIGDYNTDNVMELSKVKLTQELVTSLKNNYNGTLSAYTIRQYETLKMFNTMIEEASLRYPESYRPSVKEQAIRLCGRVEYDEDFKKWALKCVKYGSFAVIPDWTGLINQLYRLLKENNKLHLNPEHDFFRNYSRLVFEKETIETEESLAKLAVVNDSKYLCDLSEYGLVMVYPKTKSDFIKEGIGNNNCVGSYYNSVINGQTLVVFIRKISEPEKSYITCELNIGYRPRIQQFNLAFNASAVKKEEEAYIKLSRHLQTL